METQWTFAVNAYESRSKAGPLGGRAWEIYHEACGCCRFCQGQFLRWLNISFVCSLNPSLVFCLLICSSISFIPLIFERLLHCNLFLEVKDSWQQMLHRLAGFTKTWYAPIFGGNWEHWDGTNLDMDRNQDKSQRCNMDLLVIWRWLLLFLTSKIDTDARKLSWTLSQRQWSILPEFKFRQCVTWSGGLLCNDVDRALVDVFFRFTWTWDPWDQKLHITRLTVFHQVATHLWVLLWIYWALWMSSKQWKLCVLMEHLSWKELAAGLLGDITYTNWYHLYSTYIAFISFHLLFTSYSFTYYLHYCHTIHIVILYSCESFKYNLYIMFISHVDIIYTLFVYCLYIIFILLAYHLYIYIYIIYIHVIYIMLYAASWTIVLFLTPLHLWVS